MGNRLRDDPARTLFSGVVSRPAAEPRDRSLREMNDVSLIGDEDHHGRGCCNAVSRGSIEVMKKRDVVVRRPVRGFVLGGLVAIGLAVGTLGGAPAAQAQLGAAKPVNVAVRSLVFVPKKFDAKVKQKINFVWRENVAHNIVFDKKHKSPTQNKGSWSTSFDKAGTYKFKCTLHPGMNGEVKVK